MITHLSYDQLSTFCALLAQRLEHQHLVTLTGSMGAGKTTLVKHILMHYGIHTPVTSPTYAYVAVYKTAHRVVYHFDLYRIKSFDEFLSLGFEEYFADHQALIIVEWPEIIERLLSKYQKRYTIALEYYGTDIRLVIERQLCSNDT